jgi:uncharacterized protein YukJ
MDGSDQVEPVASLKRLLIKAHQEQLDVYVFGRFYVEGDGVHDCHMNQGSTKGQKLHGKKRWERRRLFRHRAL